MASARSALDHCGGATNKSSCPGRLNDSVRLASLTPRGVEDRVTDETINSQGFSRDGGMVAGEDRIVVMVRFGLFVFIFLFGLLSTQFAFLPEALKQFPALGLILVIANDDCISGDAGTLLYNDLNISAGSVSF